MRVSIELNDFEIRNAVCSYLRSQGFEANPIDLFFKIDNANDTPNCITSSVAATPANQIDNLHSDYWKNN